ncbi:response regulator [Siphonobacter aquaeclarae]|jgi:two-component system response regulator NreC|uniref:Two component transcriptional regulator, LuxR family n=1 Tax=Siphonobacter aquaeclarae TaxID=563176 RepID=A0A1G9I1B6_9BACT|nr:response regulator transcription factor [Siphonobacter aquaeclarae]MBO9637156.1 response regulator transcription factor [Siphonobacter aquaeclarae]SDL19037.1 two component transcriptional regulator, LuxR family [Siphonobacter aquaeclarae]
MIRVLIADDHNVFVEGIESLISGSAGIEVTERCYSAEAVMSRLALTEVDVILLDISFPRIEDGLSLCEYITRVYPGVQVIALTMHDDASLIKRVVRKGAKGYLLKNTTKSELLQAIETVCAGKTYFNDTITTILLHDSPKQRKPAAGLRPNLTPRESEVLNLISQGLTTQQMANQLFVSVKAVEFHRSSLLLKFDVPNTALLIKTAMELNYID